MEWIKIVLESDLCVSSGEGSGNSVDSDICVDSYGIPFIPARRIKGCLRQAAEKLLKAGYPLATQANITELFGDAYGTEGGFYISDGTMKGYTQMQKWLDRIKESDANRILRMAAHPTNIKSMFSSVRGQTKMQDGIKVDNSLRFTRVLDKCNPLNDNEPHVFYASIVLKKNEQKLRELLNASCKAMRHIGLNRNRGLGDVSVYFESEVEDSNGCMNDTETMTDLNVIVNSIDSMESDESKHISISYYVSLDAPISIPGIGKMETSIPGRSVIGCMAGKYLENQSQDDTFDDLFLNGTVIWSALTPVINGKISTLTPLMIMKLKNGNNRLINRFAEKNENWKKQKPKTLDGCYSVKSENGYVIASPLLCTNHHVNLNKSELYSQQALSPGMIYGGTVIVSGNRKDLAKQIVYLLSKADLSFGRSKGAQYATCRLSNIEMPDICSQEYVNTVSGETVYVILRSELGVSDMGVYVTDTQSVRSKLAQTIEGYNQGQIQRDENGNPSLPEDEMDICQYTVLGGYQGTWNLQKPHIQAVKTGSVYCFTSKGGRMPRSFTVGEFLQEGLGDCELITSSEMKDIVSIKKSVIDQKTVETDQNVIGKLQREMLTYIAKETMKKFAREYIIKDNKIPIGRLRLMVSEASSYEDLLKRVDSIKKSDIDSKENEGRKKRAKVFLNDIYIYDKNDSKKLLKKIIDTEPGLYELLNGNELLDDINKLWKLPLTLLLHTMHYTKER